MKTVSKAARWRWLAVLGVLALVAAACQSGGGEDSTTTEGTTATTTATTAAPTPTTTPPVAGFPYNVAIFSDPTTANPWASLDTENDVWTGYVTPGATASLYTLTLPSLTLTPVLASEVDPPQGAAGEGEAWFIEHKIHDSFTWSDGTAVTSADVVFTFNTVRDLILGGNFTALWPVAAEDDPATEEVEFNLGITGVTAVDDSTFRVDWNKRPGLSLYQFGMAQAPIYQEAYWGPIASASADSGEFYAHEGTDYPVFGAYSIDQREPGAFYRNKARTDYWDAGSHYTTYSSGGVNYENMNMGITYSVGDSTGDVTADYFEGPYASESLYSLYGDQNAAVLALTEGDVDFMLNPLGLQRGLQQQVLQAPDLDVISNQSVGFRYLSFNTRRFPGDQLAYRQAISCRIDKEFIASNVLGGVAIPMNSVIPAGLAFWANPDVQETCPDMDMEQRFNQSVTYLKDAGWTWTTEPVWDVDNRDVVPKGEGLQGPNGETVPNMILLAPGPGYDPLRATFSLIIADLARDLGIPLAAEPTGFSVIVDKVFGPTDWDMYILGWGLGVFPDHVDSFFASDQDSATGGFNTPGYSNPEYDELAFALREETDLNAARDLIQEMDLIISTDLPYVVLFTTPILEAYRTSLQFPFTDVLGGIQRFGNGLPTSVSVTQ